MGINGIARGDIVNFDGYDRITDASVVVVTPKALLVKWAFEGNKTSERWIPKSVITEVRKNRKGKGYILTVPRWFWDTAS